MLTGNHAGALKNTGSRQSYRGRLDGMKMGMKYYFLSLC